MNGSSKSNDGERWADVYDGWVAERIGAEESVRSRPGSFRDGQTVRALRMDDNFVDLDVSRHDPTAQTVMSHHVTLTADGVRLLTVAIRYAWPSELDLMGELAGLKLRDRWGGWDPSSFRVANRAHVSVYGRA